MIIEYWSENRRKCGTREHGKEKEGRRERESGKEADSAIVLPG